MSIMVKFDSAATIRSGVYILVVALLLTYTAYARVEQNQPAKAAGAIDKDNIGDAIDRAKQDNPESIYYVEQIARAKAVQAIPMMEEKFLRTQDELDKAHIASALVRLGDKNDVYWDYLVKQATQAVEDDAPNFMSYDSHGKSVPGPSPQFVAWAKAHNLAPEGLGEEHMYRIPGTVGLLALTGDPRAVPLLRRALLSPTYQTEIVAAMGLAEIGDKDSIPFIIEASRKAPAEVAAEIARSLVYFDDTEAQNAVDKYVPQDSAKIYRDAKANGKKKPFE